MRIGVAADHAGLALKEQLIKALRESGKMKGQTYTIDKPVIFDTLGNRINRYQR